ncbi:MAG: benzoate-CoA ligase family protein [Dermatophilaceae bacterium]
MFNAQQWLVDRHVDDGLGDHTAVEAPGGSLTYRELSALCGEVAAGLRSLHLHRDDRIVIVMNDEVPMISSILGVFRGGFVAVPVSTMLGAMELREIIRDSAADAVIASFEYASAVAEAIRECPDVDYLVVDGPHTVPTGGHALTITWEELVARGRSGPAELRQVADTTEDEWALWLYTSGTTGKPKGAMHRHETIKFVGQTFPPRVLNLTHTDRCLSIAKMFFSYGIGNSLFYPLSQGATTILEPRRPTPEIFGERLVRDKPTIFDAVPTFFAQLLASDLPEDTFASVRLCVSAGEPLPTTLQERFIERFHVPMVDGIGCTEFLNTFLSNTWDDIKPGTTGKPIPPYEIELRAPDGTLVPRGEPGTMWVKGPTMAIGYWKRVATSRQVFVGEWCNTGDTFLQDEDGYFVCLGRTNDLIKAGGIYVSPAEIENRLLKHDGVAEVAVVGLPDEDGLYKPVAFVVKAQPVTEDDLVHWCRDGMAAFKRPRRVVFVDELPKTATGKMQRFRLREGSPADATTAGPG